jgi:hypothetical protein
MSSQVNAAFVQKFRDNFIHLSQQKGSKLRDSVRVHMDVVGKYDHFDRIGQTSAQLITSRHADTPTVDTPHSRRRVTLSDYNWADLVDRADEIKMLSSPASEYMKAGVWAMGRTMDDIIITAYNGNATSVSSDDSTSNVAFDSNNQIAHGSADLSLGKVIQAAKILADNDVDPDEERYAVVGPAQIEAMLNSTTVTSSDYNSIRLLMKGEIDTFMGFKWVTSTRLPVASSIRKTFFYAKSAMGVSVGMDVVTSIDKRPDKNNSMQPYAQMSLGATRVEEAKIVEVACDESA